MPKRGIIGMCLVALAAYFSGNRQGKIDGEMRGFGRASALYLAGALSAGKTKA